MRRIFSAEVMYDSTVLTESPVCWAKAEVSEKDIYVCAASDGKTVRVLLANYNDTEESCVSRKVRVSVPGATGKCRCLITDGSHMNVSRELPVRKGRVSVTLDPYSIVLLEFE